VPIIIVIKLSFFEYMIIYSRIDKAVTGTLKNIHHQYFSSINRMIVHKNPIFSQNI